VRGDVEIVGRPNKAGVKGIEARLKFDVQHVTPQTLSDRIGEDRDIDEMKYGDDYHLYSLISCVCSNVSERKVWNSYRKIPWYHESIFSFLYIPGEWYPGPPT
jgi:hypothetical protein